MIFWTLIFLLTLVPIGMMLVAAQFAPQSADDGTEREEQRYRQQLQELEADHHAGRLDDEGLAAGRAEIGRRLLRLDAQSAPKPAALRRSGLLSVLLVGLTIPVLAIPLYLFLGSPEVAIRDQSVTAEEAQPIAKLVEQAEARLRAEPDDVRGWRVLAPVYLRLGRLEDAIVAYQNIMRLDGENPAMLSRLGELKVLAAQGTVTADAVAHFRRALEIEAENQSALYYLGFAAAEAGNEQEAKSLWERLMKTANGDEPWVPEIRRRLEAAGGNTPSAAAAEAIAGLGEDERRAAIQGMVDSLADRLADDPGDREGWIRLVRSHVILGEVEKAAEAADTAKKHFPDDAGFLRRLETALNTDPSTAVGGNQE